MSPSSSKWLVNLPKQKYVLEVFTEAEYLFMVASNNIFKDMAHFNYYIQNSFFITKNNFDFT